MKIAICGPNLRDQSKGQFHIHAADCADLKHYGRNGKYGGEDAWVVEGLTTRLEISEEIHCDILGDYGLTPEDAEGREMLQDWMNDLHFLPCTKGLLV